MSSTIARGIALASRYDDVPSYSLMCSIVLVAASLAAGASRGEGGQSATMRQQMEGEQLFHAYCAACHGADGKGHGPAASALKTPPADLTSIARRNAGSFPHDRVIEYVANGDPLIAAHGSRDMPIWGPNFAALAPGSFRPVNERLDAVVAYIESIQLRQAIPGDLR